MYAAAMQEFRPSIVDEAVMILDSSALVDDERASLLDAAVNARTAAMLTGTHGVVAPPLDQASVRLPAPSELLAKDATWTAREAETETTSLLRARAEALADVD